MIILCSEKLCDLTISCTKNKSWIQNKTYYSYSID